MTHTPYPAYRPTDLPWLAQIPAHWDVKRLKYVAMINPSKTEISHLPKSLEVSFLPMELVGEGTLTTDETKTLESVGQGFTCFRDGDVVVAKITPSFENGKGAIATGLVNGIGFGTTELHVIRPSSQFDKKFLYYLTISYDFREIGAGMMQGTAGQKRVPDSFLIAYPVAVPPLPEQRTIAAFLDRQTAKIDALIAKKGRLLDLLAEQRAALIDHSVTKGLNSKVKMKDSGLQWLGNIPEHWDTIRSKRLFGLRHTKALDTDKQLTVSQEFGVITQEEFMAKGNRVVQVIKGADILKHVEPNDFIISMRSFQGGIEWAKVGGSTSSAYVVLIPSGQVHCPYFSYLLKCQQYIQALQSTSNLIRDGQALRYTNFCLIDLPIMPIEEQKAIAEYLDKETARINSLVEKVNQAIARLREYRAALISAAVTGKIQIKDEG
jgi:type I restriction enzyme, S subunit